MKHIYLFFIGLLFASFATLNAQTTVTWALTADQNPDVSTGTGFTVSPQNTDAFATVRYDKTTIGEISPQAVKTGDGTSSLPAEDFDANVYLEYTITCGTGFKLTVSNLAMNIAGASSSSISAKIAYSTDGFSTSTDLTTTSTLSTTEFTAISENLSDVTVASDGTFKVRVYPMISSPGTGKYFCSNNVAITFTAEATSGISEATADAEVVKTEYYSLTGAKLTQPTKGLNIVKETLSNGKVVCSKKISND